MLHTTAGPIELTERKPHIVTIDKTTLTQFRVDFQATVKELEDKYQVAIELGNISYSMTEFHGKLTVYSKGDTAKNIGNITLKAEGAKFTIGDKFVYKNAEFEVIGYNAKKGKMPVMLKSLKNGSQANASIAFVNSFFNNSAH